jgi:hypothetical protein
MFGGKLWCKSTKFTEICPFRSSAKLVALQDAANWSVFEKIHSKKHNKLELQLSNYNYYNL